MEPRISRLAAWAAPALFASLLTGTLGCKHLGAQGNEASASAQPADPGWPRQFTAGDYTVVVHEPQVDRWENYMGATFRAAISVQKKGDKEPVYGTVRASCPTVVDFDARTVTLGKRTFEEVRFIGATGAQAERLKQVFLSVLTPEVPITYSLDRALAAIERSKLRTREVKVNLDPPPIYYSDKPAILVFFLGRPKFGRIQGTNLLFATNTNWDVFMETGTSRYYLRDDDTWLTTGDVLKGPWTPAATLPADLAKLPKDENWEDVLKNLPGKPAKVAPVVLTTTVPAELVVTEGKPELVPIPGTKLFDVKNSGSDLFFHGGDSCYYLLAEGRWFRTKELTGPWSAASGDLPADFRDIAPDSDEADVLPSVPGTPEAEEAAIQASIPRTATVKRSDVTLNVVYQGQPKFLPIQSTTLQYAVNTPFSVFLVEGKYYCCHQGIWFVAAAPSGPWAVATVVPAAIYTIPPTDPHYNVTYVYVYNSTPQTVTVGYTSGYCGEYIVGGVVVFGAALITAATIDHWLDEWADYWHYHCYAPCFAYGCGVVYNHYTGGYFCAARYYGPYGGGGRWAAYNPNTGIYSRGAYRYGPYGSAFARGAYNPSTGAYAGRVQVNTPYGSWGRGVISNGEDWIRGGYRSGPGGSAAGIRTSEGGWAIGGHKAGGEGGFIAHGGQTDNTYIGHDGNVYRRDDNGNWSKWDDGGWNPVEKPLKGEQPTKGGTKGTGRETGVGSKGTERPIKGEGVKPTRPTAPQRPSASQSEGFQGQLNKQAYNRQRGDFNAQRSQSSRSNFTPSRSISFPTRGAGGRGFRGR